MIDPKLLVAAGVHPEMNQQQPAEPALDDATFKVGLVACHDSMQGPVEELQRQTKKLLKQLRLNSRVC